MAFNLDIHQSNNILTSGQNEIGEIEDSELGTISFNDQKWQGVVDTNGYFILNRTSFIEVGEKSKISIEYSLAGEFSSSGWFGTYSYNLHILYVTNSDAYRDFVEGIFFGRKITSDEWDSDSCTYTADFSGDWIEAISSTSMQEPNKGIKISSTIFDHINHRYP